MHPRRWSRSLTKHLTSIDASNCYEGIWANFSLLHAAPEDFPTILKALHTALKDQGVFHIGMKTGTGRSRDGLGRLYTYFTEDELSAHLNSAGFQITSTTTGEDKGLAGTVDPWVIILSQKRNS